MPRIRVSVAVLAVAVTVAIVTVVSAQVREAPTSAASTAVLAWAAFDCSVYAEMSGQPTREHDRLFDLGYDNGRRFLEAERSGTIRADEIKSDVPIGFNMFGRGPTVEFAIGRVYEVASQDAYDRVVKTDDSGLPVPIDKWETNAGIIKTKAANTYRSRNCALLK